MERLAELVILALLAIAAWRDVLTRRVPDWIAAGLALIGLALRLAQGPRSLGLSLAAAGVLFVFLLVIYARQGIGGGDVKLATAMAIGLAPLETGHFVVATTLAGGVVGLVYFALRLGPVAMPGPAAARLPARLWAVERWRARRRGVPYAVAIAAGAAIVLAPSIRL